MRSSFNFLYKTVFRNCETSYSNSNLKNLGLNYNTTVQSNITNNRRKTVKHIYNHWNKKFSLFGISEPSNSIVYILAHIFQTENVSDVYKKFSSKLSSAELNQIQQLCEQRLKRMPIQYVLGEWNFCGMILKMEPPVFIPRPETEELINIFLKYLRETKNQNTRVLEICCGSGAISLSLLKSNLNINVTAIDQSNEACKLTRKNARIHQLDTRLNVLQYQVTNECRLQELEEKFDVIVTNPPYVPSAQVREVQPEIQLYEDLLALDGGVDGLSIIKSILFLASEKLIRGGKLFMEIDVSHPALIRDLIHSQPELQMKYVETFKDFCKKDRFVLIEKL